MNTVAMCLVLCLALYGAMAFDCPLDPGCGVTRPMNGCGQDPCVITKKTCRNRPDAKCCNDACGDCKTVFFYEGDTNVTAKCE